LGTLIEILINDIVPIFVVIGLGYAFARRTHADIRTVSRLTFYVLSPSLVFASLVESNVEGGEIAQNLSKLYDFCASALTEANLKSDSAAIESVNKVVLEIKSGWEAVAAERQKRAAEEPARSVSCGA